MKKKTCENAVVVAKCPKSCGKRENDNNVVCPGLSEGDCCNCDINCTENQSFCTCDEAQKCCSGEPDDENKEKENIDYTSTT